MWKGSQSTKASLFKEVAAKYNALDRESNKFKELVELGALGTRIHADYGTAFGPRGQLTAKYHPNDSTLALAVAPGVEDAANLQIVVAQPLTTIRNDVLKLRREARAAAKKVNQTAERLDSELDTWAATQHLTAFPGFIPEPGYLPNAEVAVSTLQLASDFFAAASSSQIALLREDGRAVCAAVLLSRVCVVMSVIATLSDKC
jgi:hypothetical protein